MIEVGNSRLRLAAEWISKQIRDAEDRRHKLLNDRSRQQPTSIGGGMDF
jgi:hypothetical protein